MSRARGTAGAALLAALAGCAGAPVDRGMLGALRPLAEFPSPEAVHAAPTTIGFGDDDRGFAPGDVAIFGLVLETHGAVRRWLAEIAFDHGPDDVRTMLGVTVNGQHATIPSRDVHLRVRVSDADGAPLRESTAAVGDTFLRTGIVPAAEMSHRYGWTDASPPADLDEEETRLLATSILALPTLFRIVQDNEALAPILWDTVSTPSWWSVVTNLGVRVGIRAETDQARFDGPDVLGSGPTCTFPVTIYANDEPALLCTLHATDPRPPFRLGAGIVAAEAVHPTDAGRRFSMRLLAARRGSD
ncbi:MAG: hypothetical protein AB7O97_20285 [Planctomycetota bacterium]